MKILSISEMLKPFLKNKIWWYNITVKVATKHFLRHKIAAIIVSQKDEFWCNICHILTIQYRHVMYFEIDNRAEEMEFSKN